MRLLDRLNTPRAVLVVLTIAIAVNVLIFVARGTEPLDSISQSAGVEQPRDPQTRGEDATGAPRGQEEITPLAAERHDAEEAGTEETQPRAAQETDRGGGEEADRRGRSGEDIAGRRDPVGLAAQSPGTLCTWERVYERPAGAVSTVFAGRWATVALVKRASGSAWSWVATVTKPVWGWLWVREEAPVRRSPDTAAPEDDGAAETRLETTATGTTEETSNERSQQVGQQTGGGQQYQQQGGQYEQQGDQYQQQQRQQQTSGGQYGGQYGRQTGVGLEQTGGSRSEGTTGGVTQ